MVFIQNKVKKNPAIYSVHIGVFFSRKIDFTPHLGNLHFWTPNGPVPFLLFVVVVVFAGGGCRGRRNTDIKIELIMGRRKIPLQKNGKMTEQIEKSAFSCF